MAHNSRSDVFHSGAADGGELEWMSWQHAMSLPSGDAPGRTVRHVARSLREKPGHVERVAELKAGAPIEPVTVVDGTLVDGHHRVAAARDARRAVPFRRAPA